MDTKTKSKRPVIEARHTPGPWKAHGRTVYAGETPIALGISDFDATVAPVYANHAHYPLKDDDEAEANARLVAAAPELLTACELAIIELSPLSEGKRWAVFALIEKAIAKARGQ